MSQNIPKFNTNLKPLRTIFYDGNWKYHHKFKKKKEIVKKTTLIVNPDFLSKELIKKKSFNRKYSYNFWSGKIDDKLIAYLKNNPYDYILIDKWVSPKDLKNFLNLVDFHGIGGKVINIVHFYEQSIGATPVIYSTEIEEKDITSFLEKPKYSTIFLKRVLDVFVTLFSIPFVIPIVILAVIATKLSSKGPAIFKQTRVGLNGKLFTLYKIRTMHSINNNQSYTVKDDKRITKLGKFFRKTKIDELPQLWNVLKGDMSLIGPRPERDEIVEKCCKENQFYAFRHIVKPGITGWAQVNNPTATPNENLEKLEYDLYYINNLSWKLELKIVLQTVGVVSTMDSL
ncbi:MAG: sugar transferase [Chitinophagaceae bacterium]